MRERERERDRMTTTYHSCVPAVKVSREDEEDLLHEESRD
jgi:hypothetical protein